jgi:hypothetical protein
MGFMLKPNIVLGIAQNHDVMWFITIDWMEKEVFNRDLSGPKSSRLNEPLV